MTIDLKAKIGGDEFCGREGQACESTNGLWEVYFQILPFVLDYTNSTLPAEEVVDKYIALIVVHTAAIMRDETSRLTKYQDCCLLVYQPLL